MLQEAQESEVLARAGRLPRQPLAELSQDKGRGGHAVRHPLASARAPRQERFSATARARFTTFLVFGAAFVPQGSR